MKGRLLDFISASLITLSIIITIYFVINIIIYPLIGIEVNKVDNKYFISNIYENGWANNVSIYNGDEVLKVDGQSAKDNFIVNKFNRVEMAHVLVISHNNQKVEFATSYKDISLKHEIFIITSILFNLIVISLAIFLYIKAEKSISVRILIYFLLTIGLCYISSSISARGDIIGRIINTITLPLLLIFFIHFLSSIFNSSELKIITAIRLKFIYISYFILQFFLGLAFFLPVSIPSESIQLLYFSVLLFLILADIINYFFKNRNSNNIHLIKLLLTTLAISCIPFTLFYALPTIVIDKPILSAEFSSFFIILIPIFLIYTQISNKIIDINFHINKLKYFISLAFPFSILTTLSIGWVFNQNIFDIYFIFKVILIFILIVLLLYLKDFIDLKVSPHLFSDKNEFGISLYLFFQRARYKTNVESLISYIKEEIEKVITVSNVQYIRINKCENTGLWNMIDTSSSKNTEFSSHINWDYYAGGSMFECSDIFGIIIGETNKSRDLIYSSDKVTKLNPQEKMWLESLAYVSSILIENISLMEDLIKKVTYYEQSHLEEMHSSKWFSRLLFNITEKERIKLSSDLHDSILQEDLKMIRNIDRILAKSNNPLMDYELNKIKESIIDNVHLLRETCNNLRPQFLNEHGLAKAIEHLINTYKLQANFRIYYNSSIGILKISHEYEISIYRVIQELLNNAYKHSEATELNLSLYIENDKLVILYDDDGKGLEKSKVFNNDSNMGLLSIRERVLSLNGSFEINSSLQQGLHICILI